MNPPRYEVSVRVWEGPPGTCCTQIGEDDEGEAIYTESIDEFTTAHVPRVGDLIPAGPGMWRVTAVQWSLIVSDRSPAWAAGDRGGMVDLAVEPAEGIFA